MTSRAILMIIAGLVIGVVAAIIIIPGARDALFPTAPMTRTAGKALVGGPFTLTDETGKRVTEKDFSGRYTLVFFGYTSCPDICPASLQLIAAVLGNLGAKADRITPIFISVDPERDTPQKLGEYVKNFDPRIVGLTGTPEEVAAVAKAYKVYYRKVPNSDSPSNYAMDHTSILYVMGPDGSYLTHFTPTTSVEDMTAKLEKVL